MPVSNNVIVSTQPLLTGLNGGRKEVMLENGWIIAVGKITDYFIFYKTEKGDWSDVVELGRVYHASINDNDISIVNTGNVVHFVFGYSSAAAYYNKFDATQTFPTTLWDTATLLDNVPTLISNISLAKNPSGTKLAVSYDCKTPTYSGNINIRSIEADVLNNVATWGSPIQTTLIGNSAMSAQTPCSFFISDNHFISISVSGGNLISGSGTINAAFHGIYLLAHSTTLDTNSNLASGWSIKTIELNSTNRPQQYTNAYYIPPKQSGKQNGEIIVAWNGTDDTDTTMFNIRTSSSTDFGGTWSTTKKLTTGNNYNQYMPSITVNNIGNVWVVFNGGVLGATDNIVRKIKRTGEIWGSVENVTASNTTSQMTFPNTLDNINLNFSEPLFIYRDFTNSQVRAYGTYDKISISPLPSDIGIKSSISNIFTYNVTSGTASFTAVEKINGVTVGTKNLTSGQNTTVSVTQTQWDAVRYGKYSNSTAGRNTLTIDVLGNTYSYTFDKTLRSDDDVLSIAKSVKDEKETYIPSVKKVLSDAINNAGGTTTQTATFVQMADAIKSNPTKKYASGTLTQQANTASFPSGTSSSVTCYYISLDTSVIGFIPTSIVIHRNTNYTSTYTYSVNPYYIASGYEYKYFYYDGVNIRNLGIVNSGSIMQLPVATDSASGRTFNFEAFG